MSSPADAAPLAAQWSQEKNASIDWRDPEDVFANGFTFLQLLSVHSRLAAYFDAHPAEKQHFVSIFLSAERRGEQAAALSTWDRQGLLALRTARWCRGCGHEGHTRARCPQRQQTVVFEQGTQGWREGGGLASAPPGVSKVMEKYRAHQQHIARLRLLEEKKRLKARGLGGGATDSTRSDTKSGAGRGRRQRPRGLQVRTESAELFLFTDERRRGVLSRVDTAGGIGFLRVCGFGEIKFFLDSADYGVKSLTVGDAVSCKVDISRGFAMANDVRLEKPLITQADAVNFIACCKATTHPIGIITMLLMHPHEWQEVLRWVQTSTDLKFYADAVHTLIELITFIENREPIHLDVLQDFLTLTLTAAAAGGDRVVAGASATATLLPTEATDAGGVKPFFPDMVEAALRWGDEASCVTDAASASMGNVTSRPADQAGLEKSDGLDGAGAPQTSEEWLLFYSERWVEVVNYLVLLRQHTRVAPATLAPIEQRVQHLMEKRLAVAPPVANHRQLEAALQRLLRSAMASRGDGFLLLPTAAELSVPPPLPESVFSPANLPINGVHTYSSTEDFIRAQCQLLRADTFETTSRLLPAVCYHLPGYHPSPETAADAEHARLFWKVRFMGRVTTRDRDYANAESYLLQVEPKSPRASLSLHLHQGVAVCITTGLDRSCMRDDEIFWGIVSSSNADLLRASTVVVAPYEFSMPFEGLQEKLLRNEAAGREDCSMLLETPIFLSGYTSIMKALRTFLGPLAVQLPLADKIVGSEAAAMAMSMADPPPPPPPPLKGLSKREAVAALAPGQPLLSYIPPHCMYAFKELAADFHARFALDAGQEAVMQALPHSRILLVQGPPGTGKSFMGCCVVETYVRYKQIVASGDILQKVDVDYLAFTRPAELLPALGPVVVITYKNHALDEFLVDMLDSGLWDTKRPSAAAVAASAVGPTAWRTAPSTDLFPGGRRLVRIGGRSREPRLDAYNLNTLLHGMTDKSAIRGLKERIFLLHQRLDRLVKEIQYLERGKVPKAYFMRWLTPEQQQHITFEEREAWLRGERYVAHLLHAQDTVDPGLYLTLLRTKMGEALQAETGESSSAGEVGIGRRADGAAHGLREYLTEEEDEVPLSVFQEMKREDESREFNDALNSTYLSSEAIHLAQHPPTRPAEVPAELLSLWSLDPVTRHTYYAYLIQLTIATKARNCLMIMHVLRNIVRVRNHAVDEAKLSLLRGADVVGLTTTGCAANQNLLRSLRPSMLVVEEAAEVLESQLLACVTDSLQQIILIGDHYQLQPKVDTFLYEKINHLNLSLFERLARHLEPIRLTEQRRLHPSLSTLIRPFYDPQPLLDHPSLLTRPFLTSAGMHLVDRVPGLAERAFFWCHNHPEEEVPGSRSKINTREVRMVQQVVRHLLSEGALQKSITVITPYLGQCRMLRSMMRLSSMPDICVSTVDLYQGDENDIVILSMTRTRRLTEFIRMRNRLIVCCSRARFALVLVGNDALLTQCAHWAHVLDILRTRNCVGERLPVTYQSRPGEVAWMEVTEDTTSAAGVLREVEENLRSARAIEGGTDDDKAPPDNGESLLI